jgi:uncharacterized protein
LTVAVFFLDTSVILKRYVLEIGTPWVQALAVPTVGNSLFVARITQAETIAALTRRERGGSITPQDAATAVADFDVDFRYQYLIVEIWEGLVTHAATLARKHILRGYDAVQLAAALEIRATYPSLILLSADAELNAAALAEGLSVDDPNRHP